MAHRENPEKTASVPSRERWAIQEVRQARPKATKNPTICMAHKTCPNSAPATATPGNNPWDNPSAINVMRRKTKKIPRGLEEIEISMKAIKAQRVGSVWMAVCEHIMTIVFSCGEWLDDCWLGKSCEDECLCFCNLQRHSGGVRRTSC